MITINYEFLSDRARELYRGGLKKAHETDAGFDLRYVGDVDVTVLQGAVLRLGTGIRIALPAGFEAQVRPRSGLAFRYGVTVLNAPGTVDAGYRGELLVILHMVKRRSPPDRSRNRPLVIRPGDRIAQLVVHRLPDIALNEGRVTEDTDRGAGGFGSTGVE